MAREKQDYRETIEFLGSLYPGKAMLNINEAAQALGCCVNTAKKIVPFTNRRVAITTLARIMCGG
jgi:hypothetical protein